jgi:uncharacterized protein YjbJ (UPF0337 family)
MAETKTQTSGKTIKKLMDVVEKNQQQYEGYKESYVSKIANEIDRSKPTIVDAFDFLAYELEIARTWKEGNKRYIRLTIDRGHE